MVADSKLQPTSTQLAATFFPNPAGQESEIPFATDTNFAASDIVYTDDDIVIFRDRTDVLRHIELPDPS